MESLESVALRPTIRSQRGLERRESSVTLLRAPIREVPMWTVENRPRYDRSTLRYPSDLTDQEWGLIKPLIPPAKRGGRKRTVDEREIVNGIMYVLSPAASGVTFPKTCRREARCTTIWTAGATTAHWSRSTTPFT